MQQKKIFFSLKGRKEEFEGLSAGLERCQKSLTEYLNTKRAIFPRFNFISDDELLGILGSNEPSVIQEHIGKMFDNLKKFRLGPDLEGRTVASALISNENEIMEFQSSIFAEGKIEEWMVLALEEMRKSNRYLTKKAVYNYGKVKNRINQIYFTFFSLKKISFNKKKIRRKKFVCIKYIILYSQCLFTQHFVIFSKCLILLSNFFLTH